MGPLAAQLGAVNVLLAGSALAFVAFVLGFLPRQTRMLERLRTGQHTGELEHVHRSR
jgi:hypothetical protein